MQSIYLNLHIPTKSRAHILAALDPHEGAAVFALLVVLPLVLGLDESALEADFEAGLGVGDHEFGLFGLGLLDGAGTVGHGGL